MSNSPWYPADDEERRAPDHDPVHDSDARSAGRIRVPDGAETAPCVLVADDDPDMRDSLRLVFEDAGYDVVEAADGIEAMDALHMSLPSVVLLDVLLPGISGYEVLLRVAENPVLRTRHAYCLLTAVQLTDERIGPRFNELITSLEGAILAKPFDLETLLACVATLQARLLVRTPGSAADAAPDNGQEDMEDMEGRKGEVIA